MCLFNCTEILFHSLILLIPFRQTLQVSPEIYPFISLTQNIIFVLALIHKSWRLWCRLCQFIYLFQAKRFDSIQHCCLYALCSVFEWIVLVHFFYFSLSLFCFLSTFHLLGWCWRPCWVQNKTQMGGKDVTDVSTPFGKDRFAAHLNFRIELVI